VPRFKEKGFFWVLADKTSSIHGLARLSGIDGQKDTRIAQSFAGENGVQWDPVSELFKVIVGGAIIGVKATWDDPNLGSNELT
jgi:hypothetical protein